MPPLNLRALGRIAGAARRRELVQLAPPRTQARQHHPSVREAEKRKLHFFGSFFFRRMWYPESYAGCRVCQRLQRGSDPSSTASLPRSNPSSHEESPPISLSLSARSAHRTLDSDASHFIALQLQLHFIIFQPFDDGDSNATKWKKTQGWRAAQAEKDLPTTAHDKEVRRCYGSIRSSSIIYTYIHTAVVTSPTAFSSTRGTNCYSCFLFFVAYRPIRAYHRFLSLSLSE